MSMIECVYGLHFSEIANNYREKLDFKGASLGELIDFLDERYHGFKEELIDLETGDLRTRNQTMLDRKDESARPLFLLDAEIKEGDMITFY